ncbi:HAAS signaling domain-containing protein [Actinoplanes sp. NPDC051494]|uniref:HAAS signaling domain-containing protein n=1 Tax=Actinoplanes sp. NPDC051494 TaxID=3363907 RepID=UPI00379B9A80
MTSGPDSATPLVHTDVLVLDYLAALWAASDDLEPELRDELMTTVADYIALRRHTPGDRIDDPEPILRRLGPPEALAAAARRGRMPVHLLRPDRQVMVPDQGSNHSIASECAAMALLTAGAVVLPGAGPLAGLALVSASPRWNPAQKVAAWMLAAGPMLLGLVIVFAAAVLGSGADILLVVYALMVAGGFLAGLTLLPGLSSRRIPQRG